VTGTAVNSEKHSLFVEAGDIDGDGWTDLLFHSTISSGVRLVTYKNDRGTFKDVTAATAYRGVNARQVELADVNQDGRRDLLTLEKTRVSVWLNRSGTFPRRNFTFPLSQGRDVAVGDVNLDGASDIYVVQGENNLPRHHADQRRRRRQLPHGADPAGERGRRRHRDRHPELARDRARGVPRHQRQVDDPRPLPADRLLRPVGCRSKAAMGPTREVGQ
jgi:hypothetical protein